MSQDSVTAAPTETKAQRAERLKAALNPWAAYAEIERFAREGFDSIPPEWLNTYFRWWGLYTQGDGVGAVGGKGGEGKAVRHFMQRIRIPNGILTAPQLRAIAGLADRYARGVADITVRQNIQLHWVEVESLPAIIRTLDAVGITTLGTCGDVTRNITGCPLAGADADEIADTSSLVESATAMLNGAAEFYNLDNEQALALYRQEHGAPGATMRTFGDAAWFTCSTLSTVGYGDITPVTEHGRVIAVGIMAVGLGLLGAVTGTFASWLLQVFSVEDDERPSGS